MSEVEQLDEGRVPSMVGPRAMADGTRVFVGARVNGACGDYVGEQRLVRRDVEWRLGNIITTVFSQRQRDQHVTKPPETLEGLYKNQIPPQARPKLEMSTTRVEIDSSRSSRLRRLE